MLSLILLVPFYLFSLINATPNTGDLSIEIHNVQEVAGNVHIGLYTHENFLDDNKVFRKINKKVRQKGSITLVFEDLPFGTYGFGIYHDINTNMVCDRNFFGIPTEPYGISKNPTNRYSKPSFEQCKFVFDENHTYTSANLKYW